MLTIGDTDALKRAKEVARAAVRRKQDAAYAAVQERETRARERLELWREEAAKLRAEQAEFLSQAERLYVKVAAAAIPDDPPADFRPDLLLPEPPRPILSPLPGAAEGVLDFAAGPRGRTEASKSATEIVEFSADGAEGELLNGFLRGVQG